MGLANAQGLLIDEARHLLWVCSGTMGHTTVPMTPSALKGYDLDTAEPRVDLPMPDAGYCNDLAKDERGNLYITDSKHPRILKLEPGAMSLTT